MLQQSKITEKRKQPQRWCSSEQCLYCVYAEFNDQACNACCHLQLNCCVYDENDKIRRAEPSRAIASHVLYTNAQIDHDARRLVDLVPFRWIWCHWYSSAHYGGESSSLFQVKCYQTNLFFPISYSDTIVEPYFYRRLRSANNGMIHLCLLKRCVSTALPQTDQVSERCIEWIEWKLESIQVKLCEWSQSELCLQALRLRVSF